MKAYGLARVGRDVEVRYTQSGEAVANVSLAFSWGKRDEAGKRPTQWVEGSLWGKRAESLAQYLTKGVAIVVTLDDLHIETYTARDNTTGTKLAGRISDVELAGGGEQRGSAPAPAPAARAPAPRAPAAAPRPSTGFDDMDEDIPF